MGAAGLVHGPGQARDDGAAGHTRCGKRVAGFGPVVLTEKNGYHGGRRGHVQQGPAYGTGGVQGGGGGQAGEQLGRHKVARVRSQVAFGKSQRGHVVVHRNASVRLLHINVLQPVGFGVGAADAQVGCRILGANPLGAGREHLFQGLLGGNGLRVQRSRQQPHQGQA